MKRCQISCSLPACSGFTPLGSQKAVSVPCGVLSVSSRTVTRHVSHVKKIILAVFLSCCRQNVRRQPNGGPRLTRRRRPRAEIGGLRRFHILSRAGLQFF